MILRIFSGVLDFIFPRSCLVCGRGATLVCEECLKTLPPPKLRCLKCSGKNPYGLYCTRCISRVQPDLALAQFDFSGPVRELIHLFKYKDFAGLNRPLGLSLAKMIRKLPGYGEYRLTPIPLSPKRQRMRGYNQSRLLAEVVSSELKLPVMDLMTRIEAKQSQVKVKDPDLRRQNVRGVFSVCKDVEIPEKIILIDDVITTGATIEEATRTLKVAGAQKVIAVAVAMAGK